MIGCTWYEFLIAPLGVIWFGSVVIALPSYSDFLSKLQVVAPGTYASLGSPSFQSTAESAGQSAAIGWFVCTRQYRSLCNDELTALGDKLCISGITSSVVLLLAFVALFVSNRVEQIKGGLACWGL